MSTRTTMPLTGTVSKPVALLDFRSLLALHYAAKLVGNSHHLKPHLSAIARRALLRYVHHLEALTPEELTLEAHSVAQASKSLGMAPESVQKALQALEDLPPGQSIPRFAELVCGALQ